MSKTSFVTAVLNQKGGSGKTTLSAHLARGLQIAGSSVLLIDTDPQMSLSDWFNATEETDQPLVVQQIDAKALPRTVEESKRSYDHLIIDGRAELTGAIAASIKIADSVLIPVQPSALDLWSAGEVADLVQARQEVTDGKPLAAFVIVRQIIGTALARDVQEVLATYPLPCLESRLSQRVAFTEAMAAGETVLDDSYDEKAKEEIRELIREFRGWING